MKLIFTLLFFSFNATLLLAQSPKQISDWLYDLPISKNAKTIKKSIEENNNFSENIVSSNNHSKYANQTYGGKILTLKLVNQGKIDSAKVQLQFASITTKEGYSGNLKLLKFEYFSKDSLYIDELFNKATAELKDGIKSEKPSGFNTLNDASIGRGTQFIYSSSSTEVSKIDISRIKYSNGRTSFQVMYVGSTE